MAVADGRFGRDDSMVCLTAIRAWRSLASTLVWSQGVGGSNSSRPDFNYRTTTRIAGDRRSTSRGEFCVRKSINKSDRTTLLRFGTMHLRLSKASLFARLSNWRPMVSSRRQRCVVRNFGNGSLRFHLDHLRSCVEEWLASSFDEGPQALQDAVNEIGTRLGFTSITDATAG